MLGQNEYLKKVYEILQKCIFSPFILFWIFKLLGVNSMMPASGNMHYGSNNMHALHIFYSREMLKMKRACNPHYRVK